MFLLVVLGAGERGGDLDSDEAKLRSKRTKELQAKNTNKNNTFQSDTRAGPRIANLK